MGFQKRLDKITKKNNSLLCIGLDPDFDKIPKHLKNKPHPFFQFNKEIILATHDLVCSYKPNSAFYEALGQEGVYQLKMTCDYIKKYFPDIPVILDAKRADIGNTNEGYMKYTFDYLNVDAITLQPYLGGEALAPFLNHKDKGFFILVRTSNPGAGEFQDLLCNNKPLYQIVAGRIVEYWNKNNNCMMVVGATYPEQLEEIRKIACDMSFLVPGIGSQGGDVEKTVKSGLNSKKAGMIINSSRGIIYAGNGKDFAEKARKEAMKLRDEINKYRK